MSGTNDYFTFGSSIYAGFEFSELPKGNMLVLKMNPYNGLVVVQYNHSAVAMEVIDELLREMGECVEFLTDSLERCATFSDLASYCKGDLVLEDFETCPFCGEKPDYDESAEMITCCGGRLVFYGFESRAQAVRAWNDRSAFRVKVA